MKTKKSIAVSVLINIVLSSIILFSIDMICLLAGVYISTPVAVITAFVTIAVLMVLTFANKKYEPKNHIKAFLIICAVYAIFVLLTVLMLFMFSKNTSYKDVETGKEELFSDKTVMLIVPHEDDDFNVLGGVIEEYIKYKSEVYVVYVTNGDKQGLGETRIKEAIDYCEYIGIPEQNVIFLGYGDAWPANGPHIYNSKGDLVLKSYFGKTKTYGSESHPAFNNGNNYTYNNYFSDVKNVILQYQPDIIFCSDYDSHPDHRAVSLIFEKALGTILKDNPKYQPDVYKGYAYCTAFEAKDDFHKLNIVSTINPFPDNESSYIWEDRDRFPVMAAGLSRSIFGSEFFKEMAFYKSQDYTHYAGKVINGDKVFWHRRTDSLLYNAKIDVSSGENSKNLTDFMILDNNNLYSEKTHSSADNVWSPDAEDNNKSITVQLESAAHISDICLYDNPSLNSNIVNAKIVFDDGSTVNTGCLNNNGSKTVIQVNKDNIKSFKIFIDKTDGQGWGLSEIEAYSDDQDHNFNNNYIKLIDEDDNFVYDYIIQNSDKAEFKIYQSVDKESVDYNRYSVMCDNNRCTATVKSDCISVSCPKNQNCTITIKNNKNGLTDSVYVSNPNIIKKAFLINTQRFEGILYNRYISFAYSNTVTVRTIMAITSLL